MPKIEQTLPDDYVRSHTFRFITPAMTDNYKIPNPCNLCHNEKSTKWPRTLSRNGAIVLPGERNADWS